MTRKKIFNEVENKTKVVDGLELLYNKGIIDKKHFEDSVHETMTEMLELLKLADIMED